MEVVESIRPEEYKRSNPVVEKANQSPQMESGPDNVPVEQPSQVNAANLVPRQVLCNSLSLLSVTQQFF